MNIAIIGGGASGVLCAINLKKKHPNYNVTIYEQNSRLLKKVIKTGNGKCNILNKNINSEYYNDFHLIDNHKDIDVYNYFTDLGLVLKELTLGRVYPYSEQASTVVNVLLDNINKLRINVSLNEGITDIKKDKDTFLITGNQVYTFDKVIIATGSKSQESTNIYEILKKLSLNVTPLRPGLVSFDVKEKTKHLSGLRVKTTATVNNKTIDGEILFKDDGLSGILAFDISRFVKANDIISLDLMSEYDYNALRKIIKTPDSLMGIFPKMLALDIIDRSGSDISKIPNIIKNYTFTYLKSKGFNESQITIGGLNLNEIDNNFMVKKLNGLYVIGETLDVDGACGGYNLYFAWLSALACSNSI